MAEAVQISYTHELKVQDDFHFQLFITVPWSEVDAKLNEYARELRRVIPMPGYRPGRAPVELIRRVLHKSLEERLREWFPEVVRRVVQDQQMDVVTDPVLTDYTFIEGQPLVIQCRGTLWPPVSLKPLTAVTLPADLEERWQAEEQARIDQAIETLRQKQAILRPVTDRGLQAGDTGTLRLKVTDVDTGRVYTDPDGEEVVVTFGSPVLHPAVTYHLEAKRPGDAFEWEMDVVLPWELEPDSPTPGRARRIRLSGHVENVYTVELPSLEELLEQEGFESLDEWRSALRERMMGELAEAREAWLQGVLVDALIAEPPVLPDWLVRSFLREEVEQSVRKQIRAYERVHLWLTHLESITAEALSSARQRVIRVLALHHFIRSEGLTLTDEEWDQFLVEVARRSNRTVESLRAALEADPTQKADLTQQALFRKATHVLMERLGVRGG
jgi:trigger factor